MEVQLTECLYSQVWLSTAVAGRHEVTVIISVKGDTTSTPAVKMILAVEMESPNVQVCIVFLLHKYKCITSSC